MLIMLTKIFEKIAIHIGFKYGTVVVCQAAESCIVQCVLRSHNNLRCVFYRGLIGYKYFKMLSNGEPQMLTTYRACGPPRDLQDKLSCSKVL